MNAADLLFARARSLDERGNNDDARTAYLEVLRVVPDHFGALTRLGALFTTTGHRAAAKEAFVRALAACPQDPVAHANLATLLCAEEDFDGARDHYRHALRIDPTHRNAHRGLAIVLHRLGQADLALEHGRVGFRDGADRWRYRGGEGTPVSVLLILSAGGNNTPVEPLVDDRLFAKWTLIPEFFDTTRPLPPHDVVFNCVGDADRPSALAAADAVVSLTRAPVLNPPTRVRATGRMANAQKLARIPGVRTARTVVWARDSLAGPGAARGLERSGFSWPLLVRSVGYHTGHHFLKVDRAEDLSDAIARLPGEELLVMEYIDVRAADGKFRKFRVLMVDGALYPLHLAVSSQWKVHYFSADMAESGEHRLEDARFLEDMSAALGSGALRALEGVRDAVGLDYGGVDFALDSEGNLVVFEANATMIVTPPADDSRWGYRVAPVDRAWKSVARMLERRAAQTVATC